MFCENALHCVADLVNPSLLVLAVAAPLVLRRGEGPGRAPWRVWLATVLTLATAFALAALDAAVHIWPRLGLDCSTHTAVAAAIAVSLGLWRRLWLAPLVVVLAGYAALMVRLRYHTLGDIVTTAAVVAPLAHAAHRLTARGKSEPSQQGTT